MLPRQAGRHGHDIVGVGVALKYHRPAGFVAGKWEGAACQCRARLAVPGALFVCAEMALKRVSMCARSANGAGADARNVFLSWRRHHRILSCCAALEAEIMYESGIKRNDSMARVLAIGVKASGLLATGSDGDFEEMSSAEMRGGS